MTVLVTLTVVANSGVFFDNLPGHMSFSFKTGGSVPSQAIQLRNGGAGALNWTLTRSTSDGGNWLSASAASGTAPTYLTVSVVPAALPGDGLIAGTYTGQLLFRAAGRSVTIPVSLVGDHMFNQVNPISFTMPTGGANPLPQILTMASIEPASTIRFNAVKANAKGGNWLQISPTGVACCYTPEAITVSVNASTLAAGTYTAQITLIEYGSNDVAMTVPVTLTVAPTNGPYFDNVQGHMSFSFLPSASNPPSQSVLIRNAGTGTLDWTLVRSTSDNSNWLSVSAASGTAPSTVVVGVTNASLPGGGLIAGIYTGQLLLRTPSGRVTIPVSVAVGDPVFKQVNALSFTMASGGANPPTKNFNVASTGTSIRFNAVAAAS
jgi:hypothetical protein